MDLLGLWFGFAGIVVGAVVTFITETIMRKSQNQFDMAKEVRQTLMMLNDKLVGLQSKILSCYDSVDKTKLYDEILHLKEFHFQVMEAYKIYRIHLGDNKAYELSSAIFNFYYEKAHEKQDLSFFDYKDGHSHIKNCVGLMINDVRYELVKINSLKKITKKDIQGKNEEYKRYALNIVSWLNDTNNMKLVTELPESFDNVDRTLRSLKVIGQRVNNFNNELALKKVDLKLDRRYKTN